MASETVTVLFTDLVGSTELAARLGPAGAEELRRSHFGLLRGAVADTGGNEVKNLGDGLMVVFGSPSQALACAGSMQQAIDRNNRTSPEPLSVRIGVSLGEADAENGDYFGEPVIEAARLCAAANGGQVLVADVVRALVRGRGHTLAPVGDLELKGLPEPLAVCELAWVPAGDNDADVPLPSRLQAGPTTGFVGRTAEREVIIDAEKQITAGNGPRVVLIAGEGGVGKSTLTAEAARNAFGRGALVLYGRCDEDLGIPYQPFAEALHHYAAHAPDSWLTRHDPARLAALTNLVPAFAKRLPGLAKPDTIDAESEQYVLFSSVAAVLADMAADTTVVVVLDDLHWSDRQTAQLLRYLAASECGRVLFIGTYRDNELSSTHPLTESLAALRRESAVERIALSGFNDLEVVAFMEAAAGHELDEEGLALGRALYAETDGNPFFVREVLLHLVETGTLVQEGSRWVSTQATGQLGLPESVREVVGARVARLGAEASAILSAAAVIGQEFDLDLLCAVTDRGEDQVLDVLDQAGLVALVLESAVPGRFRFAHALVQHTLYEDLGPTRQARLHQRAASELEILCGADAGERVGELARHFLAATRPSDASKAVTYASLAGERALAAAAPDEAERWFTEAVAAATGSNRRERVECLIGLGHAQRLTGHPEFRETLLEACRLARDLDDTPLFVRAAIMNTRGITTRIGNVDGVKVSVLEEALDRLGDQDSPERARVLCVLASELAFDPDLDRRIGIAHEAIAMARRIGDDAVLFDAIVRSAMAAMVPEYVEEWNILLREARSLADHAVDPDPAFHSYGSFWYAIAQAALCRLEGVDECLVTMREAAQTAPSPQLRWGLSMAECWRALLAGRCDDAERLAQASFEVASETGQDEAFSFYAGQLFNVRYFQGRLAEMLPVLDQVANEDLGLPAFWAAMALGHALSGDRDRARALVDEELGRGFDLPYEANWMTGMSVWSETVAELDHAPAAAVLFERLEPWPHLMQIGSVVSTPGVAHSLARLATVLGRPEDAERYFEAALKGHRQLESPFLTALTLLSWAEAINERDNQRAREMATESLDLARRHGFALIESRAVALTA